MLKRVSGNESLSMSPTTTTTSFCLPCQAGLDKQKLPLCGSKLYRQGNLLPAFLTVLQLHQNGRWCVSVHKQVLKTKSKDRRQKLLTQQQTWSRHLTDKTCKKQILRFTIECIAWLANAHDRPHRLHHTGNGRHKHIQRKWKTNDYMLTLHYPRVPHHFLCQSPSHCHKESLDASSSTQRAPFFLAHGAQCMVHPLHLTNNSLQVIQKEMMKNHRMRETKTEEKKKDERKIREVEMCICVNT